jgi:hypothetical protein
LLRLATSRVPDGLSEVAKQAEASLGPAIDRPERLVRDAIGVLAERLPFVTLLLHLHGNTKAESDALARRREFDRFTAELVKRAAADGDLRADIDPRSSRNCCSAWSAR